MRALPSDRALAAVGNDLPRLPIVEVVWRDSTSSSDWSLLAEARKETLLEVRTVGRLIRCDRRIVAVVQTTNNNGKVNQNWMIPRSWVVKITELRPRRRK